MDINIVGLQQQDYSAVVVVVVDCDDGYFPCKTSTF